MRSLKKGKGPSQRIETLAPRQRSGKIRQRCPIKFFHDEQFLNLIYSEYSFSIALSANESEFWSPTSVSNC